MVSYSWLDDNSSVNWFFFNCCMYMLEYKNLFNQKLMFNKCYERQYIAKQSLLFCKIWYILMKRILTLHVVMHVCTCNLIQFNIKFIDSFNHYVNRVVDDSNNLFIFLLLFRSAETILLIKFWGRKFWWKVQKIKVDNAKMLFLIN